jgi:hypothetical protein
MSNITEYNLSNLPTADVVKEWDRDNVKEFLQRNRTDLEIEENDINTIYDQKVTGKVFLRLKEEQLTRDPGPFQLLFGPASSIVSVVNQINKGKRVLKNSQRDIVYFSNNTEYLLILVLFFPVSYCHIHPKNTFMLLQSNSVLLVSKS